MESYLVLTAVGEDRPGLVARITGLIADSGCNVADSRMSVLGTQFAFILLLAGEPEAVAAVAAAVPGLAAELGLFVTSHPSGPPAARAVGDRIPYEVRGVCLDHPGVVHEISHFLAQRNINIGELTTRTHAAPVTGAPLFSMRLAVEVSADQGISGLRRDLEAFCDSLGVDVEIRPLAG
ncbi:MAG: glycine cleavage system protein R [Nitrospirae bacterium CG18_big_fil_WC_8_21_14_2_50_70_55]|nr:ACT domain-containing protein [Deltaproteobacteria bacterium]OIP61858.1 MAG: hypothetical protein AUK30_11285 [Nitrospirae bacterium CG2_30_70_394]PIQ04630.1 MAG: glycine cleavage system protein R [Nitrospirae bacterium CG18_big_fil_WC_8_21_14_2_50_70_55]PIU79930.1 MAG: glycine cleavage system protein R [Nitrospirae bacterium CG06_land_8_20_14_3_00_70_43]PIW82904.1 MAG: glycine cleavage system protein R [Nitrospirae bacterium CG_4_8_14_3_um_filter_70_85]PIX83210.1 MAG: glycine cleavage syst